MSEWQPIETAPKDGSRFIARCPKHGLCHMRVIGALHETWQITPTGLLGPPEPTHWMPLPAPPEDAPHPPEGIAG